MRRGLTTAEAEAGVIPPPLTKEEWRTMHAASLQAEYAARRRTADATRESWVVLPPLAST